MRRAVSEGSAPRGGIFTSRMLLSGGGLQGIEAMECNATRAMEELASVPVDVMAYCCTVSGALRGVEGDRAFCQEMAQRWGMPVTSTMLAATEAMQHLGMRQVVVTSPPPRVFKSAVLRPWRGETPEIYRTPS